MSENWNTKAVSLQYWFGEICLFRKAFNLSVANIQFMNYASQDPSLLKPYNSTNVPNDNKDGYMLHSVPLDQGISNFWIEDGYIKFINKFYNHYYINLALSYEEYLAGFSSKTRSTLMRKIKKFEKQNNGTIDWRIYSTTDEISEFHKLARNISKETYQEKLLNVGLPDDAEFCDDMMQKARENKVKGFLLFMDNKPVSYLYTPITNGRFFYAYLGYLPEVSKYSAGIVLQLKVLEYLFNSKEGKIFDFTEGQSDQKKLFSTDHVHCGNLICLKFTFANYFWLQLNRMTNFLSNHVGNLLDKIGLKKTIKKILRR